MDRLDKDLTIGQMQGKEHKLRFYLVSVSFSRVWLLSYTVEYTDLQKYPWSHCLSPGKFQMQVLPQCGHAVHEDAPEKVRGVYMNVHCGGIVWIAVRCLLICERSLSFDCVVCSVTSWFSFCEFVQLSLFDPDSVCCCFPNLVLRHLLLGSRCSSNIYGPAQIHWV